ncbi:DMT family transporter [Cellulosilyticum sp. WCF-2]|uniref:DMT family transporter n=1 Tax=Cellulosilyticum sp. WCF-2 TaxID=2497860 RepID=UPI000F8EBF52|nr:DMT family transporter [Cellulosilyticum sp. WCF-2]QEH69873.1 DMT family transporter [Cellulosilyticum sp. WCF-2]
MKKNKEQLMQKTIVVWLGALLCCALWGSAFPCIKIGYQLFQIESEQTATQILFAGCRFALAGILALVIGSLVKGKILVPKKQSYGKIVTLCMFQTVAQYVFFYIGLANTSGVKASIIEAVNVFVAIFIASLCFHQEKLTTRKVMGSIIGFLGVILVNLTGSEINTHFSFVGEGFIFLSTVAYAFSSVLMKSYSTEEDPVCLSGYQFLIGGVLMILFGAAMGGRMTVMTAGGAAMLIYLALVSAIAYSVWGILLKYNPISKVAVFGFMNPVFGVLLSAMLLKEYQMIGLMSVISLILVCLGIYIVNKEKS